MFEVLKHLGVAAWLAVTWAVILLLVLPAWAWYSENRRKCPACGRHRLAHVDRGVFYEVEEGCRRRTLHRCRACGSDFVRHRRKWIARRDWTDRFDQEVWQHFDADGGS